MALALRDYLAKSRKTGPGSHGSHEWYWDEQGKVVYGRRPQHREPLHLEVNFTDYHHGQHDGYIWATDAHHERVYGNLSFSEFRGVVSINLVEVHAEHRRKGVGRALVERLKKEFPGQQIDWGMTTTEGTALRQSVDPPTPRKPVYPKPEEGHIYEYVANCTSLYGQSTEETMRNVRALNDMIDKGKQVSYATFTKNVSPHELAAVFSNYDWGPHERGGLRMKNDYHVAYFRSEWRGEPCMYLVHSAIEYIFARYGDAGDEEYEPEEGPI